MKPQKHSPRCSFGLAHLLALPLVAWSLAAIGDPTELSETPLSGASSMEIKPNILFILDDSGSMDWTYLPDWAGGITYDSGHDYAGSPKRTWAPSFYQSFNSYFNGVAYNPRIRYLPPSYFNAAGQSDESAYPSQTRAKTNGWKAVPFDGYGIQRTDKNNLVGDADAGVPPSAFYFETVPGEFCKDQALRDCRDKAEGVYTVPATLRWCRTAAHATMINPVNDGDPRPDCQAVHIDKSGASGSGSDATYMYPRMPSPRTSNIVVTGSGETTVDSITVDGQSILSAPVTASTANALASAIADKIQECALWKRGACAGVGYQASVSPSSANTVIVSAPGNAAAQPSVVKNGAIAVSTYPFAAPADNPVAGYVKFVPITLSTPSYPRTASRTDCSGNSCTYEQEMTNFANWHAYYRTRMQAMKTAASRSFEPIKDLYRIGYFSINNNTGTDFQNVENFGGAHKHAWYDKLFSAKPLPDADTPLRQALSQAGWLFAGQYNGKSLNGESVTDPLQYYCQPNVSILSTDGYWNQDVGMQRGFDLDGNPVGDQDGPTSGENRPILDNGAGLRNKRTESWEKTISPQGATWLQEQIEEWHVDKVGYEKSVKTQPQKRTGRLTKETIQWYVREWTQQKSTLRVSSWYYTDYNVITQWQVQTRPLYQQDWGLKAQEMQLQKRSDTKVMYQEGPLMKVPKQLYKKSERDLYVNVKQVYKSVPQGLGWSTPTPVGTCTQTPSVRCTYDSANETWTQVTSGTCTNGGRGEVASTNPNGDNNFTTYETKTMCQYRYSATDVNVPESKKVTVPQCKNEGSMASPYSVLHQVDCQSQTVGSGAWTAVTSCVEDSLYRCVYKWGPEKLWDQQSDCVSSYSTGNPYNLSNGKVCIFRLLTDWTDTNQCDAGVVDGVTTYCRDQPVIKSGTDGNGWREVDACPTGSGAGRDANGKTLTCELKRVNNWYQVGSCTPKFSGKNQVRCENQGNWSTPWTTTSGCSTVSECKNLDGVPCSGPATICKATDWKQVNCNPGDPHCTGQTTAWSGFSDVPAGETCQSIGADRRNNPQLGDVRCQYSQRDYGWGAQSSCSETTPVDPPSGWNNDASFQPPTGSLPVYRQCWLQWTGPVGVTSGTCSNNGVTEKCDYSWSGWGDVGSCEKSDEIESSEGAGTGTWSVLAPVQCQRAFKADGWVASCQDSSTPGQEVSCKPMTLYNMPIDDDLNFDPAKIPQDGNHYHKDIIQAYSAPLPHPGGTLTTTVPAASEDDPSPSNAGYCVEGTSNDVNDDGTPNKRRIITCSGMKPRPYGPFRTVSCPRAGQPSTTAGEEPSAGNDYVKIFCNARSTGPTIDKDCGRQKDGTYVNYIPATQDNNYVHTYCTPGFGDPTPNTLADVAEYYFKTDLRTPERKNCTSGSSGEDVCANTSGAKGGQVMSTYTLGLGASGVMQFQEGYETDTSKPAPATVGDFYSVWRGDQADPDNGICAWQLPGTQCNWPRPVNNKQTNIDDLWHAAVNGRGIYFSAQNPEAMAAGISAALMDVRAKNGSVAAVTTTGPRLEVDSAIFQVSFTSGSWTGDVQQYKLSQSKNGTLTLVEDWSARTKLGGVSPVSRNIRFFAPGESGKLKPFAWNSLDATQQGYFKTPHINDLAQLCTTGTICLPPEARNDPDFAKKLVDFLRGDRSNEGEVSDLSKYFRKRTSVLGDIVGSEATHVKKAPWSYTDNGYGKFKADTANRAGMIYVGANDGMLHAFKADNGEEAWAFVPSFILPGLYRLADKVYQHRFFVDGTPVMGDICVGNCAAGQSGPEWRTLLVGGVNRGGRGYYALDVTDPANPKGLWEFTHANLGYTYGNPLITKLADGTWVVLVTSGYNNVSPGDGKGHLFVLKAEDGSLIRDIVTGVGSDTAPSGLSQIAAFATYAENNNTALRVYGGDLLGNLWRFDINDNVGASGYDAQLLVTLKDDKGKPQPITSRPELGLIKNRPVVFVGTGQMLGAPDMASRDTQSLYALLDRLTDVTYDNPRTLPTLFVRQKMTAGKSCPDSNPHCPTGAPMVSVTDNLVDWANQNGWYVDFPGEGERVNTAMRLMQGTLAITTNTPQEGACVPAGVSYAYFLNFRSGSFVDGTDGMAGYQLGNDLATAGAYLQTDDGSVVGLVDRDCAGKDCISITQPPFELPSNKVRRISWRELIVE